MKNIYKKSILGIMGILLFGLAGCDKKNEEFPVEIKHDLKVSAESLRLKTGEENKTSIRILEGAGGYAVFSTNEEVALTTIEGNDLVITGIRQGTASAVLSDQAGNYLKIPIRIYLTDVLRTDKQEVQIKGLVGKRKKASVEILEGNGKYEVVSDNDQVKVSVDNDNPNIINIEAVISSEEIKSMISVTDDESKMMITINVTVTPTTEPFDENALSEITKDNRRRYSYDDEEVKSPWSGVPTLTQTIEKDKYVYSLKVRYTAIIIKFKGDMKVGEKAEAELYYQKDYNVPAIKEPVKLKIIKSEGGLIWATFSYEKDGNIHYGYFCDKMFDKEIKPLILEHYEVKISAKKGEEKTVKVKILSGSGEYDVYCDDSEAIIYVDELDGIISITGTFEEGDAETTTTVYVTDKFSKKEASIKVTLQPLEEE